MHHFEIDATGVAGLAFRLGREGMNENRLLKTGIIGSVIVALCCVTPVLVLLFGVLGLSALVGGLDFVLLPALAVFLAITGYALWKRSRAS
jgi:mercuric ion transport protein